MQKFENDPQKSLSCPPYNVAELHKIFCFNNLQRLQVCELAK